MSGTTCLIGQPTYLERAMQGVKIGGKPRYAPPLARVSQALRMAQVPTYVQGPTYAQVRTYAQVAVATGPKEQVGVIQGGCVRTAFKDVSNTISPPQVNHGSPEKKRQIEADKPTPAKADESMGPVEDTGLIERCRDHEVWGRLLNEIRGKILEVTNQVREKTYKQLLHRLLMNTQINISIDDQKILDAQLRGVPHWRSYFLRDVAREYMVHVAKLSNPDCAYQREQRVQLARYCSVEGSSVLFLNPDLIAQFQSANGKIREAVESIQSSYGDLIDSHLFKDGTEQAYVRLPLVSFQEEHAPSSMYSSLIPIDGRSNVRFSYKSESDRYHQSYQAINDSLIRVRKRLVGLENNPTCDSVDLAAVYDQMRLLVHSFYDHNKIDQHFNIIYKLIRTIEKRNAFEHVQDMLRDLHKILIDFRGCLTCEYSLYSHQAQLGQNLEHVQNKPGTAQSGGISQTKRKLENYTDTKRSLFFGASAKRGKVC